MSGVALSPKGKANLLEALGGKLGAFRIIDGIFYVSVGSEEGRDRVESLFPTSAFGHFIEAWPRKSSVWFEVIAKALFSRASRAARRDTAERMCELLASARFRKGVQRLTQGKLDFERLADYVNDLLDLAGAGPAFSLNFLDVAGFGGLESLRFVYADGAPSLHEYFKNWVIHAVAMGSDQESTRDFLDFLVTEEVEKLGFCLSRRPSAIAAVFVPIFQAWLKGGADRVSAILRVGLLKRLVMSVKLEGLGREDARAGVAAALGSFLGSVDRCHDQALARFCRIYWFDRRPEGPVLWERLLFRQNLYLPELDFLASDRWVAFADRIRTEIDLPTLTLFLEFLFANIEGDRLVGIDPALIRILPSILLTNYRLLADRSFWKRRGAFLGYVALNSSSLRIRSRFLAIFAREALSIARGIGAHVGSQSAEGPGETDFSARIEAHLDAVDGSAVNRLGKEALDKRRTAFLEEVDEAVWSEAKARLGPSRVQEFQYLHGLAKTFDLVDFALDELEAVDDINLDNYLNAVGELRRQLPGMGAEDGSDLVRAALTRDYWYRLPFAAAYPYIVEIVLPYAGMLSCLPDEERNLARTDGHRIWLPTFINFYEEDPKRLPENRNLTVYVGLALHEAAHIVGGTFAVDWKPYILSLGKPLLIHALFNAIEDYRVEAYLCRITRHFQVPEIISTMNITLSREPFTDPVFVLVMTSYARAAGYWPEISTRNSDFEAAYENLMNSDFPAGGHTSLRDLGEWLKEEFATMDPADPTAAMRLAMRLYDTLRHWELPELADSEAKRRRATPTSTSLSELGAGAVPGRVVATEEELVALAEAFEKDPEACLKALGLDSSILEVREGDRSTKAESMSLGNHDAAGNGAGAAASEEGAESSRAGLAMRRIAEAAMRGCALAGYREKGELERAFRGDDAQALAKEQRASHPSPEDGNLPPREADRPPAGSLPHRRAKRPGSRLVKNAASTKMENIYNICYEVPISVIAHEFLDANHRYDSIAQKLGFLLQSMIQDATETKRDLSSFDGDLDDERLIEILSDPARSEPDFLEFFEEERRSAAVVIGLDISGSTISRVSGSAARRPRVIDVEKHFALIFARALRLITNDVSVFAFNTKRSTTIYRADPLEALSSFTPDGGNRDGDFVRYCAAELSAADKDVRYLFLISDGLPSASGYNGLSALDDTILSLREAKKAGIRVVYLNIDSVALDYFHRFANEVVYARRFRHPEDLIVAAPELARGVAREIL